MIQERYDMWYKLYCKNIPQRIKIKQIPTISKFYTLDFLVLYNMYQYLYYARNN